MQKDTDGIVQVMGDGAVFMSDPYNVVRYHRSGMTVSKMEDAGDLVSTCLEVMFGGRRQFKWECPEVYRHRAPAFSGTRLVYRVVWSEPNHQKVRLSCASRNNTACSCSCYVSMHNMVQHAGLLKFIGVLG